MLHLSRQRLIAAAAVFAATVPTVRALLPTAQCAPGQPLSVCEIKACDTWPTYFNCPDCPITVAQQHDACKFDSSENYMIYCKPDPSESCVIWYPIDPLHCDGYCATNTALGCKSVVYNRCQPPS